VTNSFSVDRERAQALMMAALDGEISAADRAELDALVARHADLADEWRRFTRLKEVTAGMSLQQPPEEIWDRYWTSTYRRAERGLAWVLISAGVIVLGSVWLWRTVEAFLGATDVPPYLRAAVAALAIGAFILVVSVIREKLFLARRDPYQKEIIR
jgi:ferric-dicitrate binding protein FerR (iron transport regulator)